MQCPTPLKTIIHKNELISFGVLICAMSSPRLCQGQICFILKINYIFFLLYTDIYLTMCIQKKKKEGKKSFKRACYLAKQFFFLNKFIYLFLAAWGLRCCVWAFSSCGQRGLLFVAVSGLLIAVASLCFGAQALGAQASVVVAQGLSSCGARA